MARRALRTHALILHTVCLADLGDLLPNMHMGPHPRHPVRCGNAHGANQHNDHFSLPQRLERPL